MAAVVAAVVVVESMREGNDIESGYCNLRSSSAKINRRESKHARNTFALPRVAPTKMLRVMIKKIYPARTGS